MIESVTHVAGPAHVLCGRLVQRCSVCGEKLLDSYKDEVTDARRYGAFAVGVLVRVREKARTSGGMLSDADRLPVDFCLSLVEP